MEKWSFKSLLQVRPKAVIQEPSSSFESLLPWLFRPWNPRSRCVRLALDLLGELFSPDLRPEPNELVR